MRFEPTSSGLMQTLISPHDSIMLLFFPISPWSYSFYLLYFTIIRLTPSLLPLSFFSIFECPMEKMRLHRHSNHVGPFFLHGKIALHKWQDTPFIYWQDHGYPIYLLVSPIIVLLNKWFWMLTAEFY